MAPKFPQRKIGDDFVSKIGLGCMGMSISLTPGTTNDDEENLKVLTAAADMGINLWVTSDWYGPYTNEKLIGRWFRETGRRDEIFLVTKFGSRIIDGTISTCGTPEYVRKACEGSLQRLGVDRIDLYMQHRVDPQTPIEKTVGAMAQLKNEGKIRYIGLSECSARTLTRAHKVHPIVAAEMEFSPFAMDIESSDTDFLKTARKLGVKIIAYSPLGRGFLTGAVMSRDDFDKNDIRLKVHPRFSEENFPGNLRLVKAIAAVAKEKGCTPSQLALAWVLAQGDGKEIRTTLFVKDGVLIVEDFIPIPGTKHVKYLKDNAAAVGVEFTEADEKKVRDAIESVGGAKGARYPEAHMANLFGNTPELDA